LALGAAAGVGLTLAWVALANGSLAALADVFWRRAGAGEGRGLRAAVDGQLLWLPDLLGLAVVGLLGCLAALSGRQRGPAAVLLAVTFGWGVVMTDGAAVHSYWLYWTIVPAAFGAAWLADAVLTAELTVPARLQPVALGSLALVAVTGFGVASLEHQSERAGAEAGKLLHEARFPSDQDELALLGVINPPADWITYEVGLDAVPLTSADDVRALADERPAELVLVADWCAVGPEGETCRRIAGAGPMWERSYELVSAAEAAARLG
jgi:hypothetical protein